MNGQLHPWVCIVIVNFNGKDWLQACLDSVADQSLAEFHCLIVDNGSSDGSTDALHLPDRRFKVIRSGTNLGFAAAVNWAVRQTRSPWILTLNPDTVTDVHWLAELQKATKHYPAYSSFGSTQLDMKDTSLLDGFGDVLSIYGIPWRGGFGQPVVCAPNDDVEVFSPCAAAALYRRDVFESLGGFEERFFCYIEDVDLGLRMRLSGHRCLQVRHALVLHAGSGIAGSHSSFVMYHSFRNRIWMLVRGMPRAILVPILLLHLGVVGCLLLRLWHQPSALVAALQGVLAGIRGCGPFLAERCSIHQARTVSTSLLVRSMTFHIQSVRNRSIVHFGFPIGKS